MPHIIVKLWPGKSDQQKNRLTEEIVKDVTTILGNSDESISVAFEEVAPADWTKNVYQPDIAARWDRLYKKPGYKPSE